MMAVFVDLEDESEPPEVQPDISSSQWAMLDLDPAVRDRELRSVAGKANAEETRANPNRNITAQALGCYPWVSLLPSLRCATGPS